MSAVVHTFDRDTDCCDCGGQWVWHEGPDKVGFGCEDAGPFAAATSWSGSSDLAKSVLAHPDVRRLIRSTAPDAADLGDLDELAWRIASGREDLADSIGNIIFAELTKASA